MFGNNGMQFAPGDWQQLALMGGLSILANNDGRMSTGQLIANGGLDALAGLQARKKYEAAMARQQEQDAMNQQKHDLAMRQGQMQMDEAARKADLMKRWQAGDKSVYKYLFPQQYLQDQRQARDHAHALRVLQMQEALKNKGATSGAVEPGGIDWNSDFGKTLSKENAKRYSEMQKNFENSIQLNSMLDDAEAALARGIYTGPGGELLQTGREWGGAIGLVDPKDVAAGESLRKIQNEMALITRNPEQGMGMPGAVSDKDIEFLKSIQVGLTRSPEANALFLKAARAIQQRKKAVMAMANEYVLEHGRLDPNFDKKIREWAEANPLFKGWNSTPTPKKTPPPLTRKDGGGEELPELPEGFEMVQ